MFKLKSLHDFFINIVIKLIFFQPSGPLLPTSLMRHSMVKLGKGQAMLGGRSNGLFHTKIYSMACSNRYCLVSSLDRELSVPRQYFVAIPISDKIAGCITNGNYSFNKVRSSTQPNTYFTLKYRMPVPKTDWGWFLP